MIPAPYKLLFECLAFLAIIAAISFGVHKFLSYEQQIGYEKAVAVYTAQALKDTEAARLREQALAKQLQDAQNDAIIREQKINALASALSSATGSLRNTTRDLLGSLPTATAEAARKTAAAFATVFSDCQGKYAGMAEVADRHASDVKTLNDAWPK